MQQLQPQSHTTPPCPLCTTAGGRVVWQGKFWRLVSAQEAAFPAFYRLIHQAHTTEWSDLPAPLRQQCAELLAGLELLMREHVQPAKMNLATLGNVVPHLHWHLIARFDWDSHFPNPVWGAALRTTDMQQLHSIESKLPALEAAMAAYLAQQEA